MEADGAAVDRYKPRGMTRILRALAAKGYSGPLSVELFYPRYQNADPYEMASRIRGKAEPVMRAAGVA